MTACVRDVVATRHERGLMGVEVELEASGPAIAWCLRRISSEWHFLSIDHAALAGRNLSGPEVCAACLEKIVAALT